MFSKCGCNCASEGIEGRMNSAKIDRELQTSAREHILKLLLLGAGESGKSTFVKQMKIIHGDGYSTDELKHFVSIIHGNLLTSMVEVIKAMDKLNITLQNPSNQVYVSKIISFISHLKNGIIIPPDIGEAMKLLWKDDGFQECLKCGAEYQLSDSAPYYFQSMNRILDQSYIPDDRDVLQSRVQTTGVVETSFKQGTITYQIVDVGGQRSERRKWLHCFDDVKAVLFVAALSGYDMTLTEDGTTNRMEESLNLFQAICTNKFFDNSSIVLFLNKLDLFTEKINNTNHHLRLHFPHYNGPDHDVSAAKEFIKEMFLIRSNKERIFSHFTTATDTSNIKVVFQVVLDRIFEQSFKGICQF